MATNEEIEEYSSFEEFTIKNMTLMRKELQEIKIMLRMLSETVNFNSERFSFTKISSIDEYNEVITKANDPLYVKKLIQFVQTNAKTVADGLKLLLNTSFVDRQISWTGRHEKISLEKSKLFTVVIKSKTLFE